MIRTLARGLLDGLRRLANAPAERDAPAGFVDPDAYAAKIARYRALGARIGERVRLIGDIDGVNPHLVSVGNYTVVGRDAILLAHCPIRGARRVAVGRFVYIGFGAVVLPGVVLGDHCIVGAGAVVTKSAPSGSILAGNPARILRAVTENEKRSLESTLTGGRAIAWDSDRPASRES